MRTAPTAAPPRALQHTGAMREESINGPAGSLAAADFGGSGPDLLHLEATAIVAGHIHEFMAQL
jgi:hypothetical protein